MLYFLAPTNGIYPARGGKKTLEEIQRYRYNSYNCKLGSPPHPVCQSPLALLHF